MVNVCSPTVVCDKSTMQQKSTLLAPPISSYKLFKNPSQLEAGAYPARKWQKRRFNEENVMAAKVKYSSLDRQAMDLLRSSRDYSFLHAQDEEDDIATAQIKNRKEHAAGQNLAEFNLAAKPHNPAVIISWTPSTAVVSKVCAPSPASLATSCKSKSIIASSASKKASILTDHTVNDANGRSNCGSSKSSLIPDSGFKKSSDLTANYYNGLTSDSKSSKCSVSKKLPSNPTEKLHLHVAAAKPTTIAQKRPTCTAAMVAAAPNSKHNIKSSITSSTSRPSTGHDELGSKSYNTIKVKKVNMIRKADKPEVKNSRAEDHQDRQQLGHGLHNAISKMLGPRRTYHDTDVGDGSNDDQMDMESSFHDIQREERRSAKIAREEDRHDQELLLLQQEVERRANKRRRLNLQ
ncbi:hypothetical protein L7F22_061522 [Adiantum nelumboides]|nr:hypothetical protein [Adiantum nelumboides]